MNNSIGLSFKFWFFNRTNQVLQDDLIDTVPGQSEGVAGQKQESAHIDTRQTLGCVNCQFKILNQTNVSSSCIFSSTTISPQECLAENAQLIPQPGQLAVSAFTDAICCKYFWGFLGFRGFSSSIHSLL